MAVHEQQTIVASGRPSIIKGIKHGFGLTIRPEQMLEFLHDMAGAPIPFDAQFEMLEFDDATRLIGFHYISQTDPLTTCFSLSVQSFFNLLKKHADGLIPTDAELDGIEVSGRFTVILLRIKSDHFPPHPEDKLPMVHLRYEGGELLLVDVWYSINKDKRIQVSSKR